MFNRVDLKKETKVKIGSGRWFKVFGIEFLAGLLTAGIALVLLFFMGLGVSSDSVALSVVFALILIVAAILLFPPILYGLYRFRQNFWRGQDNGFQDVLSGFKNMGLAVRTYFWEALWIGLWSMLCSGIMGILFGFAGYSSMTTNAFSYNQMMSRGGMVGSSFVLFLFWIAYIAWIIIMINRQLAYSQLYFTVAEHPELGAKRGLNLSKQMMKGHKGELFALELSFLPWILLAMAPIYIGMIVGMVAMAISGSAGWMFIIVLGAIGSLLISMYVGPYMNITIAGYYDRLKKMNLEQNIVTLQDFNETQDVFVKQEEITVEGPDFIPPDIQ